MTHDEARLLIGAAPGEVGPTLAGHLAQCLECTLFQQQMRQMDLDLARLFGAPLAAPLAPRADTRVLQLPVIARARSKPVAQEFPRLMALAASILVSIGIGTLFWTLRPHPAWLREFCATWRSNPGAGPKWPR